MISLSEENYLKAIYHLQEDPESSVSTTKLSEHLKTKASSVTDMIKRLSEKSLVIYKKYQGVKLSDQGKTKALGIIRKHRLWEVFLVEKLHFNWDEVHDIAEQLEHVKSDQLTERLDQFLDYPSRDPHGDPIPDQNGVFSVSNQKVLSDLNIGESGNCIGLKDSSTEFLNYLDKQNLSLGKEIKIIEIEKFDQSFLINFEDKTLRISEQVANNIYIKTKF